MNPIYIEENDKEEFLGKMFARFKIPLIEDNKIFIPDKINKRIYKKIIKILTKIDKNTIVLSEKIKNNNAEFIKYLKEHDFCVCDGKKLFLYLAEDILNYIVKKKNINKSQTVLGFCSNNLTEIDIYNVCNLSKEYKRVCVVTEQLEKIRKIEKRIFNETGQMIVISNNKQKSLLNCDFILNCDFCDELINKYKINLEADIISFIDNIKIDKKRYNGTIINDYEIEYDYGEIIDFYKYSRKEIYEANLNTRLPIRDIRNKLKKDNFKITQICGKNGIVEI